MSNLLTLTRGCFIFIVGMFTFVVCSISAIAQESDDPDLPPFVNISRSEYIRLRSQQVGLLRGVPNNLPYNARLAAIREMEQQQLDNNTAIMAAWTSLGPSPIPNGQTQTVSTAVSGRVTAIAVHPTNPNTVYVGTAQGGLYRTLDGGATWTPLMDAAQSLAIGAVTIDPLNTTTVFVGTGEGNLSLDSFFGVGLYRITNAETTPIVSGPFETRVAGTGTTASTVHAFVGTSINRIVVDPANDNRIYVGNTTGGGGISGDGICCGGSSPASGLIGLYFSSNALSATPTFSLVSGAPSSGVAGVTDIVFEPGSSNNMVIGVWDLGGGGTSGIYRTTNASVAPGSSPTFTRTLVLGALNSKLAINKVGVTVTVIAATGTSNGSLLKSVDGGATWPTTLSAVNGFCGGQCFYDIAPAIDPLDANIIYLGGSANSGAAFIVKKSTNGGTSFAAADNGLHADVHAITIAPSNSAIVFTGSDGGIWKSTNSGAAWTSLNNNAFSATQFQSIALHPVDPLFTIGGTQDNGTVWHKPDNSWTRADFGDGGFALIDQNAINTTAVTMYHTYFNQTNNIIGFGRVTTTANAVDGGWAFLGCGGTANGISCTDATLFYAPMALGPGNPNTLYFGTDRLYRSINQGTTMTTVSQAPLVSGVPISAIGISRQNDNVRIVGLRNGKVFATTTGSSTLTDVTGTIPAKYVARAVIDPNNSNTAYVTLAGFGLAAGQHVWKTTNLNVASPTWTASGSSIPDIPVNAFVVDQSNSNNLFAGTDIGVYNSTNGGTTWSVFGTGLPRVAVFDMAIQNPAGTLRIATHGRGLWEISGSPLPIQLLSFSGTVLANRSVLLSWSTLSELNNYGFEVQKSIVQSGPYYSIDGSFTPGHGTTNEPQQYSFLDTTISNASRYYRLKQTDLDGTVHFTDAIDVGTVTGVATTNIPGEFSLGQNYPNPFNPSTLIKYSLPTASDVKLEVFNTLGQRVAVLVNERMDAGFHETKFENQSLPSGVYFYTIQAGQFTATKKLTMLK